MPQFLARLVLLKCKADEITVSAAPLPSQPSHPRQPSLPPPVSKHPRRDWELMSRMCGLRRTGAWQMDTFRQFPLMALGVLSNPFHLTR